MSESSEIILDIRSGSVALAQFAGCNVLFARRERLPVLEKFEEERLTRGISDAISKLSLELRAQKLPSPARVHVCVGSPWQTSQARLITYTTEKPFEYSETFVARFFAEEERAFMDEHFRSGGGRIIEHKILDLKLNGYQTSKPLRKKARELALSFYISAVREEFLRLIESETSRIWSKEKITFHSFPLLSLVCGSEVMRKAPSYVLVDIGGEISDASLVKNGTVIENFSFPLGAHSLVREVSKVFNTSVEEADSILRASIDGRASGSITRRVEKAREATATKWGAYANGILEKLSLKYILPRSMIVIGQPETSALFISSVTNAEIESKAIDAESLCPGVRDVFLAVEILAIEKLGKLV